MRALFLAAVSVGVAHAANATLPVVLWHGMGDTCCFPFSMGYIKKYLESEGIPYVRSIEIGSDIAEDEVHGFLGNVNDQVAGVQQALAADPKLRGGFNAIGFSQGGQFFRAYVQRYNNPPVRNLITFGGQHMGVSDFPKCLSTNTSLCELVAELLGHGAYTFGVRDEVVQAQYFRDPLLRDTYIADNIFLPDINNEYPRKNPLYKRNMLSLQNFVMIRFNEDTVVVPRQSEWFESFEWGSLSNIVPLEETDYYKEDWIGLKTLNETGRLARLGTPGDHMQVSIPWMKKHVVDVYLK